MLTRSRLVALAAAWCAVVALGGCGSEAVGTTPDSGVRGLVQVDGGCPVLREGETCPARPLAATVTATEVGADTAYAEATSAADGSFELRLPAGDYVLSGTPLAGGPLPYLKPITVRVTAGQLLEIDLLFDSGVR
jgi:hypothetical protein